MASGRAARTRASAGAGVSVPRSLEHHVGSARPLDGAGRAGGRREARALRSAAATSSIPRYATWPPCGTPWEAHEQHAVALQRALNRVSVPLARVAGGFVEGRLWTQFGYARLDDYARERLDRSGRFVRDLAALDRALDSLPGLAEALTGDAGRPALGRVAARRLARVATVESAARWIALARSVSVRELERELRAAEPRERPGRLLRRRNRGIELPRGRRSRMPTRAARIACVCRSTCRRRCVWRSRRRTGCTPRWPGARPGSPASSRLSSPRPARVRILPIRRIRSTSRGCRG